MYIYTLYNMIYHVYICIYIYMYVYIHSVYIYSSVYIYILHGFTWYVYIMYICDASIDPQMPPRHAETHRQAHPQSAQNASAALASKFPLPWRRYTSNSPGGLVIKIKGIFLIPPKKNRKNTTKKYGFCRNPNQKNMGFACFFLMGKGLELEKQL